ncbi:MAG: mandelate racemase [Chloroflexi bacterium]|nr:mandelate racemase [Chloroflexota bacterium]
MKITDVTVTLFTWDGIPVTNYSAISGTLGIFGGKATMGLVTISTDAGVQGHSFLGTSSQGADFDAASLISIMKPRLMGKDPLQREELWQSCALGVRRSTMRVAGAIDVALWDLAGKVANLPIYKMLGGYRTSIPAYASSPVYQEVKPYVEEVLRLKGEGWTAYKIHPPTRPELDIEICQAVRKAVGDDYMLMLDSTWAYEYPEALKVGRAIEELNYYWYEDPLADDDTYNYVKLREKLDIPLLATEHSPGGFTAYAQWITDGATHFLRGDVQVKGGITAVMKTAHLAEAFHMKYEVHHGGNSLNNVANLHAIMAMKNTTLFEVLLPDGAQKYGLLHDIKPDENGLVHITPFDKPGLGADIDFKLIERKKTAVLS